MDRKKILSIRRFDDWDRTEYAPTLKAFNFRARVKASQARFRRIVELDLKRRGVK